MRVLLFGPVTVVDQDTATRVGSLRQAALLAVLALSAGRSVSGTRLIDAIWGDAPPSTARNALQVHASALRHLVGREAVRTVGDGYELHIPSEEIDVHRFERLRAEGLAAHARGRYLEAARLLRSAVALWRSDPLEGFDTEWFRTERERLDQLYLTVQLTRIDADLALGRHLMLIEDLASLAHDHPYDEGIAVRRMVALYRSGRQGEALAVYDAQRRALRDDLGVDPGPELRQTHARTLRQDRSLDRDPRSAGSPWRVPLDPGVGMLVGRDALLAGLETRLGEGRVHALVGPSGVGKTRLATELAWRSQERFPHGAALVSAVGITSLDRLVERVLAAVGDGAPSMPGPGRRLLLQRVEALVVLDDLVLTSALRAELDDLIASNRSTFVTTSARPPGLAGEQVTPVRPLETRGPDDEPGPAAELLITLARRAGATLHDDAATGRLAAECAGLVDGFPLAVELVAPLAVSGLAELADTLRRRTEGPGRAPVALSFASSLDRLDVAETELLDVLASSGGALDARTLACVAVEDALAALVRDGLVRRTVGPHGAGMFSVVPAIAAHRISTRTTRDDTSARTRLVRALARTVGKPGQYLPMQLASLAMARRLVAQQPALDAAADIARVLDLAVEAADIAMVLAELNFSTYSAPLHPGRFEWLCDHPDVPLERRVDLLVVSAVEHVHDGHPERIAPLLDQGLRLARAADDQGRVAQVLANLSCAQVVTGVDLGATWDVQREAIRAAEASGSQEVLAGTLALLYPTPGAPDDLTGTLARAATVARACGHPGLLALALGNLSTSLLDAGRPDAARVHALEATALAEELHNRAIATTMRGVAQSAEALTGPSGLAHVAEAVRLGWARSELRTCTEALLRLTAGVRRQRGDLESARCLGLYEAMLIREDAVSSEAERAFIRQWLDDVEPVLPQVPVQAAIADLVAQFADPRGTVSALP